MSIAKLSAFRNWVAAHVKAPPKNEWTVLELDVDGAVVKAVAYIWNAPAQREIMFATWPIDGVSVLVAVAVLDNVDLGASEFQIDGGAIQIPDSCSMSFCSGNFDRALYANLRAGNALRFGGEILTPQPQRVFTTVQLRGISDALDEVE